MKNHKTGGARDAAHAAAVRSAIKTSRPTQPETIPSVDSGGWPTDTGALRQRAPEAEALAKRLGHKLTPWVWREEIGAMQARCEKCAETALLRPRSWRGAPLSGAALTLRCR